MTLSLGAIACDGDIGFGAETWDIDEVDTRGEELAVCGVPSHYGSVDLSASVASASSIAEYDLTGAVASIQYGDGSAGDGDGLYNAANPAQQFGTDIDVFPHEGAFAIGSVTYNASAVTGCGTEIVTASSIDLSPLWSAGSSNTDISAVAMGLWFFEAPLSLEFGALNGSDKLIFKRGKLRAINIDLDATFTVDYTYGYGSETTYNGSLTFSQKSVSLHFDDTQTNVDTMFGTLPQSRLVIDIDGSLDEL
ncbi:MAG: hypothetical protein AAGC55_05265 [Myxococcota bacterium]